MEVILSLVVLLIKLFLGIILGIITVYLSLRFFDRMTEGIDELKELKKGNIAIALVLVTLIISIGTIIGKGLMKFEAVFEQNVSPSMFVITFVMLIVQLVVTLLVAVIAIYVAIKILDAMTVDIDELKELKRGNLAVALLVSGVIFVVAFMISNAIEGMENLVIFDPRTLAALLGVQ